MKWLCLVAVSGESCGMADFKKLRVWREAHAVTLRTIRTCETINSGVGILVRNQLLRAVMSVPANIAEGSAKQSDRDFARFVRIALGSATEAENHLILASDLNLIPKQDYLELDNRVQEVQKMLIGLAKRLTSDAVTRKAGCRTGSARSG